MKRVVWLGGYAVVTFLSFPHPVGERVVDLGLVLSWLAPACLLLGLEGLPPLRAARAAFAAGLVASAAILHWIYVVTVVYGHAPALAGVVAPIGIGVYVAMFTALFGAGAAFLQRRVGALAVPLALAAWWTACDHLRSFAFSGFPWATLGYAQHENQPLLAVASFTGVYGLSFAVALAGAAVAETVRARRAGRRPGRGVGLALALLASLHAAGAALLAADREPSGETLRIAVLQGNVDQGVKWSPEWADRIFENYADLSRSAVAAGAALVVWPETAVPGLIEADAVLRERLAALARETGAGFVLGAVGIELGAEPGQLRYYDSAFPLDPEGEFGPRYDKSHLVPFGEYVPLRRWLGGSLRAVARGIAPDNVTSGPGPRVHSLPVAGAPGRRVNAGVPICYELLFPDLVRRFVADGAEVLIAITNDAWYGRTGAPFQFLAITALRSAETRVWTARAANSGVSAFIDARGRVRAQSRIFERAWLVHEVPLRPPPAGGSFYTRHGDVFAGACWLGSAMALWVCALRGRRVRRGS